MWLAIWGLFAVLVLGFVGWTLLILHQQKKTWAAFAKRHKLTYQRGKFMDSPTVTGLLNGRRFSLYSGVQQTPDIRGQRFVTIVEFLFGPGFPTGAVMATKEYEGFINGLVFDQSYEPDLAEWRKDYILRTRNERSLRAYLTKDRLQALCTVFATKNAMTLFFFDELEAVLRIETSDPMRTDVYLNGIIRRLSDAADRLTPTAEEKAAFKVLLAEEKAGYVPPAPVVDKEQAAPEKPKKKKAPAKKKKKAEDQPPEAE